METLKIILLCIMIVLLIIFTFQFAIYLIRAKEVKRIVQQQNDRQEYHTKIAEIEIEYDKKILESHAYIGKEIEEYKKLKAEWDANIEALDKLKS
jgi:uncharacterized membrane protein